MPEVQLVKVVSCNFQDPKHPATNLLRGNFGKWLCPLPRKNMSMEAVFMLERSCVIGGINIGNCGSAFVTVSVSHYGSSEFETLMPSSVLMDRQQTKSGSGKTSVLMFSRDKFCESVRDKKWGIIRITCTQPFDTHIPFGLSFVHIITFEKETVCIDSSGKENRMMAKRNILNKANISSPQSDMIHKIAAASPRSLQLMKACMNLHNTDKRETMSEAVELAKEMPLRENVVRAEKISNGLSGTDSRCSKCPICCGSYEVTEIEAHAAQCTGVSNNSVPEENDAVMCPVCKRKFSAESIASHADACAEKRLDSATKSTTSSPEMERHKQQKFINIYDEQEQKTPPNSEEKDSDIKFRRRVIAFLDSDNVVAKHMKHITIGELRRLYEQATRESIHSNEIKKFAAIARSYLRAYTDSEGRSSSSKVSDNQDVVGRHPVCRRNLLSLEDSTNAQNRNEDADHDFITRTVIIHASPTTPTKRTDVLHTPKRKYLENGDFRRKRLANGVSTSGVTDDGSGDSEPTMLHATSEDVSQMVQCHLCEEFFSIADIGNHSSNCIVPADVYQLSSEREICPICDELIARDSIEEHAALCAENKFG